MLPEQKARLFHLSCFIFSKANHLFTILLLSLHIHTNEKRKKNKGWKMLPKEQRGRSSRYGIHMKPLKSVLRQCLTSELSQSNESTRWPKVGGEINKAKERDNTTTLEITRDSSLLSRQVLTKWSSNQQQKLLRGQVKQEITFIRKTNSVFTNGLNHVLLSSK